LSEYPPNASHSLTNRPFDAESDDANSGITPFT
jgi:hypothetical protein